jgi:hypothetical protein
MRDDEPIGCAGYYRRISASTLPLCFGCPAYARQSPIQIAPLAVMGPDGVWGCETKERLIHGVRTVRPEYSSAHPHGVGGRPEGVLSATTGGTE